MNMQHRKYEFQTITDVQHRTNSWSKIGFIPINVVFNNEEKVGFDVSANVSNAFIKSAIGKLKELIVEAKTTQDWSEVLDPAELIDFLKEHDDVTNTDFYNTYKTALGDLIAFKNNEAIESDEKVETKKPRVKRDAATPVDGLIESGPKGVTNKQMIPAIKFHVDNDDKEKIEQLMQFYPDVFESSRKYLGREYQTKLQKYSI